MFLERRVAAEVIDLIEQVSRGQRPMSKVIETSAFGPEQKEFIPQLLDANLLTARALSPIRKSALVRQKIAVLLYECRLKASRSGTSFRAGDGPKHPAQGLGSKSEANSSSQTSQGGHGSRYQ